MAIQRRNHGRGHTYRIDGEQVPGVTTILGATMPKPALINWAAKTTAAYAIDYWDELAALTPSVRLGRLEAARFAESEGAAGRGTYVHRLAEQHMAGLEVEIPDNMEGYFRGYEAFIADWDPAPVALEIVVASRMYGYCGTADLIADLRDGRRWLLDYKTARSGIYPEAALQSCAYAHADVYLDNDGAERPMAELGIQAAGGLHLRPDGTYALHPLDMGQEVWDMFLRLRAQYRAMDELQEWVGMAADAPRLVS